MSGPSGHTEIRTRLTAENPWPGLAAFTEADAGFFHGRESEVSELLRLILRTPVVVLHGASGLGKTSLLRAGLLPLLAARDILPVWLRLDHTVSAPTLAQQVKNALSLALDNAGVDSPRPRADETLWEYFHRRDCDFWGARNRLLTPLIIFDQFEELFTLGRKTPEAAVRSEEFTCELEWLLEHRTPPAIARRLEADPDATAGYDFGRRACRTLLSFREDFLAEIETLRRRIAALGEGRFRLVPMTTRQALDAVLKAGGSLVTPPVASEIVRFVSASKRLRAGALEASQDAETGTVEPALLSVVCRELNQRRIKAGQKQITTELLKGSQAGIIRTFYDRAFENLDPRVRDFLEDELLTSSGFRDRAAVEDALKAPGVTEEALETLVDRRVLQRQESGGVDWIELTHDLLTAPAQASRAERQSRIALAEARAREESARRAARRTRRAAILATAGITVVLATIIVLSQLTLHRIQREQKRADGQRKRADELAGEARGNYLSALEGRLETLRISQGLGSHFGMSDVCRLAFEDALKTNLSPAAVRKFRHAAISGSLRTDLLPRFSRHNSSSADSFVVMSDGQTEAVASKTNLTLHRVIKAVFDDSSEERHFRLGSNATSVAGFSHDGRFFATTHEPNLVRLWRRDRDEPVGEASGRRVTFSGETNLMAVRSTEGVSVLELPDLRVIRKLGAEDLGGPTSAVAFAPDSKSLAVIVGTNTLVVARFSDGVIQRAKADGQLLEVRWQPAGRTLMCLVAVEKGGAHLVAWNPATDECLTLRRDVQPVAEAFDLHPGGNLVALAGTDSRLHFADMRSMQDVLVTDAEGVSRLKFSADGRFLTTGDQTSGEVDHSVSAFAIGSDVLGFQQDIISQLGTGLRLKGNSRLWFDDLGVEGRTIEITTRSSGETSIRSFVRPPLASANFGAETMLLARGAREELTVWEPGQGFLIARAEAPTLTGLLLSPRGGDVLFTSQNQLWHWRLQFSGAEVSPDRPLLNEPPVQVLDKVNVVQSGFSGDGRRFAVLESQRFCRVFELPGARELIRFGLGTEAGLLALDREGGIAVTGDQGGLEVWQLPPPAAATAPHPNATATRLWHLPATITTMAIRTDGAVLAIGGPAQIQFLRLSDGQLMGRTLLPDAAAPEQICFAPDSSLVAYAYGERQIGLVDGKTFTLLDTFELPTGDRVESLGFLRGAPTLAMTLNGGRLRRVDLQQINDELQQVSPKLALKYLPPRDSKPREQREPVVPGGTMPMRGSTRLISAMER